MAFPIPTHLPRKKDARDVSTQVLTKVSETPLKALNAKLASSWVAELDETIRLTKVCLRVYLEAVQEETKDVTRPKYMSASPATYQISNGSSPPPCPSNSDCAPCLKMSMSFTRAYPAQR